MDPSDVPEKYKEEYINTAAHEIGHYVSKKGLGARKFRKIGKDAREDIADIYASEVTGVMDKRVNPENIEGASEVLAYSGTLQELKAPTKGELLKFY
jgi:antirestriction protein ArdC